MVGHMHLRDTCTRCGGIMQYLEDKDGAYLVCFKGCSLIDLEQQSPEHLAFLKQVETHNQLMAENTAKSRRRQPDGYSQHGGWKRPDLSLKATAPEDLLD